MITPDERLVLGLKALDRLRPALDKARLNIQTTLRPAQNRPRAVATAPSQPADPVVAKPPEIDSQTVPSLTDLLKQFGSLPDNAILLGICDDRMPFVLDLTNPAPGSILIAGDRHPDSLRLLDAMLVSAGLLNKASKVSYDLLCEAGNVSLQACSLANCNQVFDISDASAAERIVTLATLAEQRRRTTPRGPVLILAIEDLAALARQLNESDFARLFWLVKHGPKARVWVIANLYAEDAELIDERLLGAFRTRLIGTTADPLRAAYLSGDEQVEAASLEPGRQYGVPFGEDWLTVWVCEPENLE
ncbi:MAG TPA: hypothetical protein VN363_03755 [Anaerolineales bacterium]|nr:hypothetical protein [Anaerolineales bacterium]